MIAARTKEVIFWGGFHNKPEIKCRVDARFVEFKCSSYLTPYHKSKLRSHFCKSKDCSCGSFERAQWRVVEEKE